MTGTYKLLVIDDDYAIRMTLSAVLNALGYSVTAVATGRDAIEKVREEHFNMAIIDIRLPDIKGTKVLQAIKEIDPKIDCLVITAYATELPPDVLPDGSSGYFIKPIDLDKMVGIIKRIAEVS